MNVKSTFFMIIAMGCLNLFASKEEWWYSYDAVKLGVMDIASDKERLYGVQVGLCDFGDGLCPIETEKWFYHQVDGCIISLAHSIERCRGVSLGLVNMTKEGYGLSVGLLPGSEHHTGAQIGAFNCFWIGRNPRMMFGNSVSGLQCGIVNLSSETACLQVGAFNVNGADFESCPIAQIGLVNFSEKSEPGTCLQIGACNTARFDTDWENMTGISSVIQIGVYNTAQFDIGGEGDVAPPFMQIGFINRKTLSQRWRFQVGFINEARKGLWLPVSNFGL